jgi:hypothetical protein
VQDVPFTLQAAHDAKTKNIVEISFDFSTMTRVFAKESSTKIYREYLHRSKEVFERANHSQLSIFVWPSSEGP